MPNARPVSMAPRSPSQAMAGRTATIETTIYPSPRSPRLNPFSAGPQWYR
jgi:hypothetical protein